MEINYFLWRKPQAIHIFTCYITFVVSAKMGMSGCYVVMKYLLVLLNFVFLVAGWAISGVAIWFLLDPAQLSAATSPGQYHLGLYIVLSVGLLLATVAVFGLCGALRASQCCLAAFFCLLTLCVVGEAAAAWWGSAHTDQLRSDIAERMRATVKSDYGQSQAATAAIDAFQRELKCCGASGPSDYQASKYSGGLDDGGAQLLDLSVMSGLKQYEVPASCCVRDASLEACEASRKIPLTASINPYLHSSGCVSALLELARKYAPLALGAAVAALALQLAALLLAACLCHGAAAAGRYKA